MGAYYDRLLDMNVLYKASQSCKKGVAWKESTQRFHSTLLFNLYDIYKELENHDYKQKPYKEFDISERGKTRHIKAPSFKDRVLQKAICDEILLPELEKYMIYDNGASRKGKGIDFAKNRLVCHLKGYYSIYKTNEGYVLLIDFKNFFGSINQKKLIKIIYKKIPDKELAKLLYQIIHSFSDDGIGIGIGCQVSQVAGMIYTHQVDNYCKIVKFCKYYGRYCDDIYIIHKDKEYLEEILKGIEKISQSLGLELNTKKTQIIKLKHGFRFLKLKFILTNNGDVIVLPNKKSFKRERQKLKAFHKMMLNKEMTFDYILKQYKSVKGALSKYNSSQQIKELEIYFKQLFRKELEQYERRIKNGN